MILIELVMPSDIDLKDLSNNQTGHQNWATMYLMEPRSQQVCSDQMASAPMA
jgi:hypothetical protein